MPRRSSTYVPNIADLIRRTTKLRRELAALMERFPEDHLDLADQIFVRFLNPIWRNQIGDPKNLPYEQKQAEAVHWIKQLGEYLRDLEACISNVMLKPELFRALPLNSYLPWPADECIRRLVLQEAALKDIQRGAATPTAADGLEELRTQLSVAVKRSGVDHFAVESGLNRDTILDFVEGRVKKPQKKTRERLETLVQSLQSPPSKASPRKRRGFRALQP